MNRAYINPKTNSVANLQDNEVAEFPGWVPVDEYVESLKSTIATMREAAQDVIAEAHDSARMNSKYMIGKTLVTWMSVNKLFNATKNQNKEAK